MHEHTNQVKLKGLIKVLLILLKHYIHISSKIKLICKNQWDWSQLLKLKLIQFIMPKSLIKWS